MKPIRRKNAPVSEPRSSTAGGCLILLYHRITELDADPQLLAVSPRNFREHLEIIRGRFNPISLDQLLSAHAARDIPPDSVVVTFDDGYADNFEIAVPLLAEYDIPATIFVTPRIEPVTREFWWDDLERIVLTAPRLSADLRLECGGTVHEWHIADGSNDRPSSRDWNVLSSEPVSERQGLYLFLCHLLRPMRDDHRSGILDELRAWAGAVEIVRPSHRSMLHEQIRAAAAHDLIEIGAHTLTHPQLSTLSVNRQFEEIQGSRSELERITGRSVTSFAYPFGCRGDFGEESAAMARVAGFQCACANSGKPPAPGARVTTDADTFALPRAIIRDWDGTEFLARLSKAFGDDSRKPHVTYAVRA
jgi:peptidoglycan/xylan/chitin deacetylase (PgdA/CDA1 family)